MAVLSKGYSITPVHEEEIEEPCNMKTNIRKTQAAARLVCLTLIMEGEHIRAEDSLEPNQKHIYTAYTHLTPALKEKELERLNKILEKE